MKDLSENLPPCLSRAAMTSPNVWSMGGRPPGPPIAGSATALIGESSGSFHYSRGPRYHSSAR